MRILVCNGPNLNLLGLREPDIYGHETLDDLMADLARAFPEQAFVHFQSNHEGALLDRLHATLEEDLDGIIINAGAWTHYSYALRDALAALALPKVEVHISHVFVREAFRHTSVIAPVCDGMISGLGLLGYHLAVQWLLSR